MQRPVERFAVKLSKPEVAADRSGKSPMVLSRIVAAIAFAMLGYACLRWLPGYPVARDIASLPWIAQLNGAVDPNRVAEFASIACFMAAATFVLPPGPLKAVIAAPVAVLVFGALIWLQAPASPSSNQPAYFAAIAAKPAVKGDPAMIRPAMIEPAMIEPGMIEPAAGPVSPDQTATMPAIVLQRDAQGLLYSNGKLAGRDIKIGIQPDAPWSSISRATLAALGHATPANVTHLTVDRLTVGEIVLADARLAIVDQQPGLTIGRDLLARSADLGQRINAIQSIWRQ